MSELQIQTDLEGKVKGFKFTGKEQKSKEYPQDKNAKRGLDKYDTE